MFVDLIGWHDSALHGQGLTGMLHPEFGTMTDLQDCKNSPTTSPWSTLNSLDTLSFPGEFCRILLPRFCRAGPCSGQ